MLRTRRAGTGFGVRAAAGLLAGQWLFGSASAFAYCRTTTCGSEKSADCAEPSKCPSGGTGIYWADATVSIGVENALWRDGEMQSSPIKMPRVSAIS